MPYKTKAPIKEETKEVEEVATRGSKFFDDTKKINLDNASIVVHNLISCEHSKKMVDGKEILTPFLSNISLVIEKGEVCGISAENKDELSVLIEILGNMRPYYKGFVKLTNLGTSSFKRAILDYIFYIDSHKMVYDDMTLIEQLMLITIMSNKDKKANYANLEKGVLDDIMACHLEDLVNVKIKALSVSTKMVIAIMVACMSNSEKVIINASNYTFTQTDCDRINHIFDYFKGKKTIVLGTLQSKLIGMCSSHVIYLVHGTVKVDCSITELYEKWDKVICSISCDDPNRLCDLIKAKFKGTSTGILDGVIYLKNYGDSIVSYNDLYDLSTENKINLKFIRFNSGRAENAFNEIKETFNDIY